MDHETNFIGAQTKEDGGQGGRPPSGWSRSAVGAMGSIKKDDGQHDSRVSNARLYFRTKLCPNILPNTNECRKGVSCTFAHSEGEVRAPRNLERTRLCHRYSKGLCQHSQIDCRYAHGPENLRWTPEYYRTSLCKFYQNDITSCPHGDHCRHAHGPEELRSRKPQEPTPKKKPNKRRMPLSSEETYTKPQVSPICTEAQNGDEAQPLRAFHLQSQCSSRSDNQSDGIQTKPCRSSTSFSHDPLQDAARLPQMVGYTTSLAGESAPDYTYDWLPNLSYNTMQNPLLGMGTTSRRGSPCVGQNQTRLPNGYNPIRPVGQTLSLTGRGIPVGHQSSFGAELSANVQSYAQRLPMQPSLNGLSQPFEPLSCLSFEQDQQADEQHSIHLSQSVCHSTATVLGCIATWPERPYTTKELYSALSQAQISNQQIQDFVLVLLSYTTKQENQPQTCNISKSINA